jgi:hypothetical protein
VCVAVDMTLECPNDKYIFSGLFQDLNKKHSDELNLITKGLKLEISLLKQPHDGKSSRSSVHQLKQEMCMEYTSSLKVT